MDTILHWPSLTFVVAGILLLRRSRTAIWKISLLALPGTIAHELSHLVLGILLFARPASFSIWPRREGNAYVLGSVAFRQIGLINGAFVTLAPLLLVLPAYECLVFAIEAWDTANYPFWALWGFLSANLLFAATPSGTDLRLGFPSIAFYASISVGLWWVRVDP
jgi:hypothetical protein